MNLNTIFRGPGTVDPPRLTLVAAPSAEPVTVDDLREFVHVDAKAEARTFGLILKAARSYFEWMTGLCLINQQWKVTFDDIPLRQGQYGIEYGLAPSMSRFTGQAAGREIKFPRAPLVTVDAFKYLDENGAEQTFNSSNYTVGSVGVRTTFGRLWLNDGADWPSTGSFPGALAITFTAGMGTNAEAVPEDIRLAVLMLAAHWYENRLPLDVDGATDLPHHLGSLIEMHRVAFIG